MITVQLLKDFLPSSNDKFAEVYAKELQATCDKYQINTKLRVAMFLAQVAHESGLFRYVRELGNDAYFDKYDTGRIAANLGNTPQKDGDGAKYKGRGLIQITGLANYTAVGKALGIDCVAHPELLETPKYACQSAGWYWNSRKLNLLADKGDIVSVTKKINGGTNGLAERTAYFNTLKKLLGV